MLGTATPNAAEWPALRVAWAAGSVCVGAFERALLWRMARRGLLRRVWPGTYEAQHSRHDTAAYVMGEE